MSGALVSHRMSDKHGSRRDLRDPETPDTLHERLRAVRDERASARASPGTSRETITPAPADRTNMSQPAAAGVKSARSSLSFDDDQARALADYIELSLQLQYNDRGRGK